MKLSFAHIALVLFVIVANGVVDLVRCDAKDLDAVIKEQTVGTSY